MSSRYLAQKIPETVVLGIKGSPGWLVLNRKQSLKVKTLQERLMSYKTSEATKMKYSHNSETKSKYLFSG